MSTPEDSQRLLAKILKALNSHKDDLNSNHALKYFAVTSKDDSFEEIMSNNEILDHIQNQHNQDQIDVLLSMSYLIKAATGYSAIY